MGGTSDSNKAANASIYMKRPAVCLWHMHVSAGHCGAA